MKKYSLIVGLLIIGVGMGTDALAQAVKIFRLKDGTVLKGQLVAVEGNMHTIRTQSMGDVHVWDADIISMVAVEEFLGEAQLEEPQPFYGAQPSFGADAQSLKGQATELAQQFMADPQLLAEVQKLAQDPEIQKLLGDPNFVQSILKFDLNEIQNNPNTQELIQNPKMQELMDKVNEKFNSAP